MLLKRRETTRFTSGRKTLNEKFRHNVLGLGRTVYTLLDIRGTQDGRLGAE